MEVISNILNDRFSLFLSEQVKQEGDFSKSNKKLNGVFLTNSLTIIDSVLTNIPNNEEILSKTFLEPSCGQGAFLLKLIIKAFTVSPKILSISKFIQDNLYFVDINREMIKATEENISKLFFHLFNQEYRGSFNAFILDFTRLDDIFTINESKLNRLYNTIDFVIGNPPYITLYGRRDKKKNEEQRIYYLSNYSQFPSSLKNGKINYVMLFIERGLKFLKNNGCLSFILDVSFFETAYVYCRKYLIEKYTINLLIYNIQGFDGVASGQVIINVSNKMPKDNFVLVIDSETDRKTYIKQSQWNKPEDEYKFRISHCNQSEAILKKIFVKNDLTLKELHPKKNLRTCVMLLNMEDKFTSCEQSSSVPSYPFYRGSNGLKYKYSKLNHQKYFHYDKALQDKINDELKEQLILKGIKNKKRVGFGETLVYDNPKVYIRQSAKELIASYDEKPSSANNSLYVFSLRESSSEAKDYLKYICGLINSTIYTFFAQQRRIIRYNKGKQPQIKISDLSQIFIPQDKGLIKKITNLVDCIYNDEVHFEEYKEEIDSLLYRYYDLCSNEIKTIKKSIESFLQ